MTEPTIRFGDLARNWQALQERVARAAVAAGRDVADLTVVAVTKTWPASDVDLLHRAGVRQFGENRAQELQQKLADPAVSALADPAPCWHFIGQLQRNKAAAVARTCVALHTLDRVELVPALARGLAGSGRTLEVFLQISLDGDARRGGVAADEVPALADTAAAEPTLRLAGVMAVPPLGSDPAAAFAELQELSRRLQRTHPGATAISAGMSGDLEIAVSHGATHLRVGTGLMGSRA